MYLMRTQLTTTGDVPSFDTRNCWSQQESAFLINFKVETIQFEQNEDIYSTRNFASLERDQMEEVTDKVYSQNLFLLLDE